MDPDVPLLIPEVNPDHLGALGIYRAYFIEPVVIFYVAVDLMRRPGEFRTVLAGFAAGTTVFAIMNLGAWAIALATHVRGAAGWLAHPPARSTTRQIRVLLQNHISVDACNKQSTTIHFVPWMLQIRCPLDLFQVFAREHLHS